MKRLVDILFAPIRKANKIEKAMAGLLIMVIAVGLLAVTIDDVVVYVMTGLLIFAIARLIDDLKKEGGIYD